MIDKIKRQLGHLENKRKVLLLEGEKVLLSLKHDVDSIIEAIKDKGNIYQLDTLEAKLTILKDLRIDISSIEHTEKTLEELQDNQKLLELIPFKINCQNIRESLKVQRILQENGIKYLNDYLNITNKWYHFKIFVSPISGKYVYGVPLGLKNSIKERHFYEWKLPEISLEEFYKICKEDDLYRKLKSALKNL